MNYSLNNQAWSIKFENLSITSQCHNYLCASLPPPPNQTNNSKIRCMRSLIVRSDFQECNEVYNKKSFIYDWHQNPKLCGSLNLEENVTTVLSSLCHTERTKEKPVNKWDCKDVPKSLLWAISSAWQVPHLFKHLSWTHIVWHKRTTALSNVIEKCLFLLVKSTKQPRGEECRQCRLCTG